MVLFFFTFKSISFAQTNSGLIRYAIKYPNENNNNIWVENRVYFNDTLSISNAFSTKFYTNTQEGIQAEGEGLRVNFKYGDEKGEIIYRNFRDERITLRFPKTIAFEEFTVDDVWLDLGWHITADTTTIGKFLCKKATGSFRGRSYTAWFTEEIPLPYGPWKLFGLPGLILQAEDSEKMFLMHFKGIEYPTNQTISLQRPVEKESKSLKEYVHAMDNYEDFLLEKLRAKLPRDMAGSLTKMPGKTNKKDTARTYKAEKIFEWEKKP